ncbi:hypothetical protein [Streptomyces sp. ME19-01-6]|uniref:hypothetical protein n=1 Tax=Streptomyces sp. ME19-01-6 TaxID=3028686 RepID=UPI0029B2B3AC|nr:hypothetical protein [Streptomyces sp. ME19-01-6]MDX3232953.1 hypothetical protein [Streptomyces sp. ME19-01-6]
MNPCTCRYCQTETAPEAAQPSTAPDPVELPAEPRPFRVHLHDRRPMDCTLHPGGQITTVMNGETWRSALTFDEMRAMDWAEARIEWEPGEASPESEPTPSPLPPIVDELPLPAVPAGREVA